MKSERGVTLATLAVYIMVIFITLIALATVTTYFSHNVKDFNTKTTADLEFDKFNLYFIEEVKKTDNKIDKDRSNKAENLIVFTKGNRYQFKDNSIIFNENIKIAEEIDSFTCEWDLDETEPQIVTITIKVGETTRTNQYVFNNKKEEDKDSGEYIYGYKNVEVENTDSVVLDNSIGTTIRNLKIYGENEFGIHVNDNEDLNYGKHKVTITITDKETGISNSVDVYLLDNGIDGGAICIDFEKFKVIREDSWYNHSIDAKYLYTYNGTSELTIDAGVIPTKISLSYYCSEEQS